MGARELHRMGQTAWPDIALPLERFAAFCAERADGELAEERAADLYICCACAGGDGRAVRCFDDAFAADVRAAIGRVTSEPAIADEALQHLRRRLFVADQRAAPGIAGYGGRGDLRGWLRVAATRAALEILRARRPSDGDAALEQLADATADPELALMRREYGAAAHDALLAAFAELEPRERNLLRQYFVDGLTIDALGQLYDVHRATAARWVEKARAALEKRTHALLRERLGVSPTTLASIVRLVRSDLHANLSGLREPAGE